MTIEMFESDHVMTFAKFEKNMWAVCLGNSVSAFPVR